MSESNKTYRIRTEVGNNQNIVVNLDQDYNTFEVLSLKLTQEDTYRLQTVNYGVIAGRVLANGGFGVPNAKVSIFIESDEAGYKDVVMAQLYPYKTTRDEVDGVRYNLLPDEQVNECHRVVGTFPNKTYILDNDDIIEIYEKYYKYTTRTNNAGDYMICGVPVGQQTVHMDLDLSDCGILSQRPRDFFYKGYNVEQFENPNQFKTSPNLDSLSQIFSQDQVVNVIPFWGNRGQGETVGITRCDINVNFKFEPTCVFMGSIVSDGASNGISKKCIPTNTMGAMDELVTGEGTIEMIRKTPDGDTEELRIKGTELINSDGVWCYQIPMNLDYMMTDEYGNMVPTNDPNKGIPTRAKVRFRVSMHDTEENTDNYFLSKVLVPNNPQNQDEVDYNFGSETKDTSFRDIFWNNVYSIKSYIPRFQHNSSIKTERFTGIKHCNINGNNNPMPYNNIRIRLPLMFTILCALIKAYIWLTGITNLIITYVTNVLSEFVIKWCAVLGDNLGGQLWGWLKDMKYVVIEEGLCPDLENWYFAPNLTKYWLDYNIHCESILWDIGCCNYVKSGNAINTWRQTFNALQNGDDVNYIKDTKSIDETNKNENNICLTTNVDYLVSCIEMNLAQQYRVINFDFYNDWINGVIYIPRWNKYVTRKLNYFFGLIKRPAKIKGCLSSSSDGNNTVSFGRNRKYTQQCTIKYTLSNTDGPRVYNSVGCQTMNGKPLQRCHKRPGFQQINIFGSNGGIINQTLTSRNEYVYYIKPCEWIGDKKVNLFATDLILLGTLNDCSENGIPQAFKHLSGTSYIMPTNLALTNMDEDGYLYVDASSNTICNDNRNREGTGVKSSENFRSFESYADALRGTEDATTHAGTKDDYLPLTEASGIAWNYHGPDQASNNITNSVIYQGGGHFLGISCFNAETNIKSCVNLSRICEVGVSMSQRKEVVSGIKRNIGRYEDTYDTHYTYYVPTGFISKDDVVDEDFRVMFATLNHRRLIADGVNEQTGYPMYTFSYKYSVGFDGALEKTGYLPNSYYNSNYGGYVEPSSNRDNTIDYDPAVRFNTYTKTIMTPDKDYYFFRLGIDDYVNQENKYIGKSYQGGGAFNYYFPMYENSFYFYFGLHPGATAIDELNKQFFAPCETKIDKNDE